MRSRTVIEWVAWWKYLSAAFYGQIDSHSKLELPWNDSAAAVIFQPRSTQSVGIAVALISFQQFGKMVLCSALWHISRRRWLCQSSDYLSPIYVVSHFSRMRSSGHGVSHQRRASSLGETQTMHNKPSSETALAKRSVWWWQGSAPMQGNDTQNTEAMYGLIPHGPV